MPLSSDIPGSHGGDVPDPRPQMSPQIRPLGAGSLGPSAGHTAAPQPSPGAGHVAPPHDRVERIAPQPVNKITQFEQRFSAKRHEDAWKRSPNLTGTGAIHVKSFHCKLVGESLEFLDQQINEWLDAHPQYEVKFVNATIGEWTGKLKEPNLIVQVWV